MYDMYEIYENYRKFDRKDSFLTDQLCSYCDKPSELYVVLENNIFLCKGCLNEFIKNIDNQMITHMKEEVRSKKKQ